MKITIDMNNFSTYIGAGKVSNIFKLLNLKDIKFEETKLLFCQKKSIQEDFLKYEQIISFAKTKTKELYDKRKYNNEYYFEQLLDNCLQQSITALNIDDTSYLNNFLKQKNSILENKLVQDKLNKLKKLQQLNV